MYEIRALNPDAVSADLAYRRNQLTGRPGVRPGPRGRWWRRATPRND
jgi:hypothetical protein